MHISVSELTSIGSDNGLSPGWSQAIIWANAGILLIGPLGTNFNEILIEIHTISFKKIHLKMSSGKWRFCLVVSWKMHIYIYIYIHGWCGAYTWVIYMIFVIMTYIDGLVQRRNSSALVMELRLSCTNPSIWSLHITWTRRHFKNTHNS